MASVFLSYSRDDTDRARPLAAALEKAGHSVWWDLNVRSGAQFSKVIEEALKAADAVVVLWSMHSVDSPWVRDEAAAGRDSGRLVPVTVDGTEPPLGFRQFQTIDLRKWSGRRSSAQLRALFADIEALAANRSDAAGSPFAAVSTAATAPSAARRRLLVPALALLAILAAASLYWFLGGRSSGPPTVAVVAADASPLSKDMSGNLLVKLGVLQNNAATNLRLLGDPGKDVNADLRFTVSGAERSGKIHANIALFSGSENIMLWSKQFEQPAASRSDLEESLAFAAARVIGCAIEEASGKHGRLKDKSRRMYLNACSTMTEIGWDTRPVVSQLREVVRDAPKFRPAWTGLLMAEADAISWLGSTGQSVDTVRRDLRADIARAREVNGEMAEATLAELELMPQWSLQRAAALVDKADAQDPDNLSVASARVQIMQSAGRMNEAVEDAGRAAQSDPLSPPARATLISTLAYAGRIDRAREELERAKKLWPGTQTVRDAEYAIELRFGDFDKAIGNAGAGHDFGVQKYIKARREPTEANVQSFLAYSKKRLDNYSITHVLQGLGEMDRVDDFYSLVEQPVVVTVLQRSSYVLFRPWLSNVRRDPRFIRLAKRLGLVDYWKQSGHWPDYCRDPDLRYDCKAEAAKYG